MGGYDEGEVVIAGIILAGSAKTALGSPFLPWLLTLTSRAATVLKHVFSGWWLKGSGYCTPKYPSTWGLCTVGSICN